MEPSRLAFAPPGVSAFLPRVSLGQQQRLSCEHRIAPVRQQTHLCSLDPVPKRGRVVVSGGTGFIGKELVARLCVDSAEVVVLARNVSAARRLLRHKNVRIVAYDASVGPLSEAVTAEVRAADSVVNLAGEPVDSGRWTPKRKSILWDSRVVGTALLARAVSKSDFSGSFISASAVGFYGTSESKVFTEDAPAGGDFLGSLARAWENAAWRHTRSAADVRTVILRIGVVLGPRGGALQKMKRAFDLFVGGPPGSGKQVRSADEELLPQPQISRSISGSQRISHHEQTCFSDAPLCFYNSIYCWGALFLKSGSGSRSYIGTM